MTQLLNRVQPGDVITADMWNLVVDAINGLLSSGHTTGIQVGALAPSGALNDPIRVAGPLQITGQNFGFGLGQSSVSFEGSFGKVVATQAQMLTGSSDTRLLLMVPAIPGLPQAGATMVLRVSNGIADDVRSVLVAPIFIPLQGDVFVSLRADVTPNPNPNPILPNQQALFSFQLQTSVNLPASFDLSANIINATVPLPADLVGSIEFHDENNTLIPNKRIDLGKNETRNIIVRIPVIPKVFDSQSFTLVITAASGGVTNSEQRSLTVGVAVPPIDPTIQIQQTGAVVFDSAGGTPDPNGGKFEGGIIKLKVGKRMFMQFNETKLGPKGDYDLSVKAKDGTTLTGWTLQLVNTQPTISPTVDNDVTPRFLQFTAEPATGASTTGAVVFHVKRRTATTEWFKEFGVQLL